LINGLSLVYLVCIVVYFILRLAIGDGNVRLALVNSFAYMLFIPLPLLLILAVITRSRIALLRLLPVWVLLLIWIGPRFIPKPIVTASGEKTIRIFTANTWVSNSLPDLLETRLRESGADVLCIEEVKPSFATEHLPNLKTLYPYLSVQPDPTRPGDTYILSRYPIVDVETIDLGIEGFPNPQRAEIEIDSQRLAIYAVHMAWPLNEDAIEATGLAYYVQLMLAFDDRLRNQQIDRFLEHIQDEPLPYIVAGDFNMSDFSATYGKLAAAMHDAFIEGGQGLGGSWPVTTHNNMPKWLPPMIRIDYIWHSDGLRTIRAWQGEETGSDHLPVMAELAFEG
jgi:endonuclease/exonuclease/phosphatase family metal-dependent hydrolase